MFNITDKEELISKIKNEVGRAYINNNSSNSISREILYDIAGEIELAISFQVDKAIRAIIDHLYTHDEFERDLGLK